MRRAGFAGARQGLEFRRDGQAASAGIGMFQQPESISTSLATSPASGSAPPDGTVGMGEGPGAAESTPRVPRWLERFELVLRVMLRMYIGLAICYAPWAPMFWDQNPLFLQYPSIGILAAHGAVRGVVSGLGLLNLWIAFQDAIRSRGRGR